MEDKRNFIEQTLDRAEIHDGRELSPDEVATEFAKLGPVDRLNHLDRLKAEMREGGEMSIGAAARHMRYSHALHAMHSALRRVNR